MTRILDRVPDPVRNVLDNWKFWIGIAYVALAFVGVWGYNLNNRTAHTAAKNARDESIRVAETQTSAETAFKQCVGSIAPLRKLSTYLEGTNELAVALVANSRANLAITLTSDPAYATRAANVARLEEARRKIGLVKSLPVPTRAQCEERRRLVLTTKN